MIENDEKYYLKVFRISRLFIGILAISLIAPSLFFSFHGIELIKNDYLVLAIIGLIAIATYYFTFGRFSFSYQFNEVHIEWIRKIPFENDLGKIKIKDVTILVTDNNKTLRLIITQNRKVVIHQLPISNSEYHLILKKIIEQVLNNGGRVIDYKSYLKLQGYTDLSFQATWMLLIAAIVIIDRTWIYLGWYSLFSLIIPLIAYYGHLKKRIKRKKIGGKVHIA